MKAILAGLAAAVAIGGAAMAQVDPDQSFTPGPPPSDQTPIPPSPNGDGDGFNQPPSNNTAEFTADMIGDVLAVDEMNGAWVGTWTRRPGTNAFDAVWRNQQGQEAHDVIRLVGVSGGEVTFRREGQSGPAGGTYTGALAPDGRTIIGAASWYQPGWVWKAVIQGGGHRHDGDDGDHPPWQGGEPATETLLFDNWNTGGCGLTDTATLDLAAPIHLARVSLWYNWQAGERGVNYSVSSGRRQVGGGTLTRGSCDPYQSAWCEARDTLGVDLDPGRYRFQLDSARLCQNGGSSGAGFIKAWGYATAGSVEQSRDVHPAINLAGTWAGNDGGTYVVRQNGDRISWTGTSGDGGRTFVNDFKGQIRGNQIVGHFQDRPGAAIHSNGDLVLRIEGPDRFVMVTPSGGFGGSVWTR